MRSIGIDIGTSSIKVVEVQMTNKGVQVVRFLQKELDLNPAYDSELEIIEYLRDSIRPTAAGAKVVMGLKQDSVSVRFKQFPFNDKLKIIKSLPFELEEDLPYSADTAIFDGRISRLIGPSAEVLAVVAPINRVETVAQRISDTGLDADMISPEAVALANCFSRWQEAPPATTDLSAMVDEGLAPRDVNLVLCLGHSRSHLLAFHETQLVGVRTILWGGKQIIEAVAKKYEISFMEAAKEVRSKAFVLLSKQGASLDQIAFSDVIAGELKELAKDLKLSMLEFQAEFHGLIQGIELTGGVSMVKNVHGYLTQLLNIPVNKTSCFSNVLTNQADDVVDAQFGVALGLAIDGLRKPRNPAIHFLRGEFAKQNQGLAPIWDKWGFTVKLAAFGFAAFMVASAMREQYSAQLVETADEALKTQAVQVAKLPAKQSSKNAVRRYIREQQNQINNAKSLSRVQGMNSALDILKKLTDAMPPRERLNLEVRRFAIEDARLTFEGSVQQSSELVQIQNTLKQLSTDGRITTRSATPAKNNRMAFAYELKVDRGIVNEAAKPSGARE